MNRKDVENKGWLHDHKSIATVVKIDGATVVLASNNHLGGVCDCCTDCIVSDDTEVLKVVDMETMEVLYSK